MVKHNELLTIFVTMPGAKQIIGDQSIPWPDPEAIERLFFERIALRLKQDLQREVSLHIKEDKHLADITSDSMFVETEQPPVYIVDLTGSQPNIYFELGICWAMKNNIIVLVSQNIADLKFNPPGIHVIPYSKDPALLEQAITSVITTVKNSIVENKYIIDIKDNKSTNEKYNTEVYPSNSSILGDKNEASIQSQKNLWQSSGSLNQQTQDWHSRRDGLILPQTALDHASSAKDPEQRVLLYRMAIQLNPTLLDAYLPLAREQRKQGRYSEALATLKQAIALFPTNTEFHQEQGLTYSQSGQFEKAISSLRMALALNHRDEKAWSVLGGLLRRIGTRNVYYDWDALRDARDSYQRAIDLNDRNIYAYGNLARLDLLLSKIDCERIHLAKEEIDVLELLCRLDLKKDPEDYWRWFDWADSCLLSGKVDESYRLYTKAIELVPQEHRKSRLSTVVLPLTNLLLADVWVEDSVKAATLKVVEELQLLISK